MNEERNWGAFCEVFGINPRNRIIEFFLEGRELDFSIGDIARITGLNRATTYNAMEELIREKFVILTRKVSGSQLYRLNLEKEEVKVLIDVFNMILERIVQKYSPNVNSHKIKIKL